MKHFSDGLDDTPAKKHGKGQGHERRLGSYMGNGVDIWPGSTLAEIFLEKCNGFSEKGILLSIQKIFGHRNNS